MSEIPAVSVLIAVHNGARFLEEALRSVMVQDLREVEIVVVDDASTDESPAILERLAAEDNRIRVLTAKQNLKLAGALNFGLEHVRAPYVARMDDDDINYTHRLHLQKRYLDAHPDVTIVGGSIDWLDEAGRRTRRSVRIRDTLAVRWMARFAMTMPHPTFMFRTHGSDGTPLRYDSRFTLAQDHDLICRVLTAGGGVVCLPDVVLGFRRHGNSVSHARSREQLDWNREIGVGFQRRELPDDVVRALEPLNACFYDFVPVDEAHMAGVFAGAKAMLAHDASRHPDRRVWLTRQTAQIAAWSLRRSRTSASRIAMGFMRYAPGLLTPLGLRALETQRLLPKTLHADPPVWDAATVPPARGSDIRSRRA